jgi:hypothetical protein
MSRNRKSQSSARVATWGNLEVNQQIGDRFVIGSYQIQYFVLPCTTQTQERYSLVQRMVFKRRFGAVNIFWRARHLPRSRGEGTQNPFFRSTTQFYQQIKRVYQPLSPPHFTVVLKYLSRLRLIGDNVCVNHLKRCKLLSFAGGRGMQLGTTSNEATWLHGMQNLISAVYLLRFSICMASGQANNRPAFFPCLHTWRNLRLRWKDNYRFIYLDVLHWILVIDQSYVFSSSDQE